MISTLKNAPLVELVAELRWPPQCFPLNPATGGGPVEVPQSLISPSDSELFFQKFSSAISKYGFTRMERLSPFGMPLQHDRPACRYKHQDNIPIVVQIGPSVFSVNALPPYKTWNEFKPWIEKSVRALLDTNTSASSFKASVRYIDAFKEDILGGMSASDFFQSKLGFKVIVPEALTERKVVDEEIKLSLSVNIPLNNATMTISLTEGKILGELAAIMDTIVRVSDNIEPDIDSVTSAFDLAHDEIHGSFFKLIKNIINLLNQED